MNRLSRRGVVYRGLTVFLSAFTLPFPIRAQQASRVYVCPPCGCSMDGEQFEAPGICPACGMTLVPRTAEISSNGVQSESDGPRITPMTFSHVTAVLSGDFYLPVHPVAALVLVHGSGPTTRMVQIARLFAERGFAVVTWDKRGVGRSEGTYEGSSNTSAANLALLAGDASAAMRWLSAQPEVAHIPLGYWGISQAGWIIPLAAAQTPRTDFITLWSGPICTVIEELEAGVGTSGNLSSDSDARALIARLRTQGADTDPRDTLKRLTIPGLWLFGGRDETLPVALSIDRLKGLIQGGQTNFEYRFAPEAGHLMNFEADRATIDGMIEWMKARTHIQ